jgi:type IX secretion system PorP/SprF family membrane protein
MTYIESNKYLYRTMNSLINNKAFLLAFCCLATKILWSQDIQFSQFYASSMYVNPAFVGSSHMGRIVSHSRYQWPTIDAKYITTLASFDFFARKINSGFGIYALGDWQGKKNLSTTELNLLYSYEIPLSEKYTCRLGLQGGYVSRYINYSILNFPDQFSNDGPLGNNTSEPFGADKIQYLDVSSGAVLYSKKTWLSLAAHHLNTPNQSFYSQESKLPAKFAISGGYKFFIKKRTSINKEGAVVNLVPSFNYKSQGKSDQFDFGLYFLRNSFISGIWYRGLPGIKKYDKTTQNNESIAALVGFKIQEFGITYSYDFVVSKLKGTRPGGAHEISLVYLFPFPKKRFKIRRVLPCPDFSMSNEADSSTHN